MASQIIQATIGKHAPHLRVTCRRKRRVSGGTDSHHKALTEQKLMIII